MYPWSGAFVSQSVRMCHGVPRVSCQTSCHPSRACRRTAASGNRSLAGLTEDIWQKDGAMYFDLERGVLSI